MKIVRKLKAAADGTIGPRAIAWKVMVVDDELDVLRLTSLNLRGFVFGDRPIELLEASSAEEAKQLLSEHADIALALIDVVMESDDAGLKLVEYIRKDLKNLMIRLVIRTGQPGVAPERYVIDHFDIDDYKDKTELTAQRLYTTVRNALKGYHDLQTIELNRVGLSRILDVTPELYNLQRNKLEDYFQGVLMQLIGICKLGKSGLISTIDGLVATVDGEDVRIRAGAGDFDSANGGELRRQEIVHLCSQAVISHEMPEQLRNGAMVLPLQVGGAVLGFVYLEVGDKLSANDRELIQIMANQCAAALDNFRLHHSLEESYEEAIDMLGLVAEFKDSATGTHIRRIQAYTHRLALALGCPEAQATAYAKASRLHDVGKVGIPDHILRKPGRLSEDEFVQMQRHTLIGDAVLKRSPSLAMARVVARSHHEQWNGNGYPDKLKGEAIPFVARLVAVVDVFDALVSVRPYKGPWQKVAAIAQIRRGAGQHFDPAIADVFASLLEKGDMDDLIEAAINSGASSELSHTDVAIVATLGH